MTDSNVASFPQTKDETTDKTSGAEDSASVAGKRLLSFLERVERLEEEKKALSEDIKEVYAEAKGVGFEPKIMKRLVKLRKMEPETRAEEDDLMDIYKKAIGML